MLLGIDIGGTKTAVCLADMEGALKVSLRMTSAGDDCLEDYQRRLAALVREVLQRGSTSASALAAVGIAAPGPLSVRRGLLLDPPNNPGWHDVPIVAMVEAVLPGRPVFLNNDANACALAEKRFGRYRSAHNLVYLTFSTGMGGGLIVNDRLVQGESDMGGEVGHQVLDLNGPECPCGLRGCFEAYCGGRNVELRLQQRLASEPRIETSLHAKCGGDPRSLTNALWIEAVREGDAFAVQAWDHFIERLAQGIGNLIMTLNPEVVLLGTIALHAGDLVLPLLREKMPRHAWSWPLAACTIAPSSLGQRIGDLSALAVGLQGLLDR